MRVDILKESGFCGGVSRALHLLDKTIKENPNKPIYLIGPIVHNSLVNQKYLDKGVIFITEGDLYKLDDESIVVISAHGLSNKSKEKLKRFNVVDTTCPYVVKNKMLIDGAIGYDILFIGKKGHSETNALTQDDESIKIISDVKDLDKFSSNSYGMVYNQTTFNINNLKKIQNEIVSRAPFYIINDTMCMTSRSLQEFLLHKDERYNKCIIVGDQTSSNANSLYEMSPYNETYFISNSNELDKIFIRNTDSIIIIGSASTPRDELKKIKDKIKSRIKNDG